MNEPTQKGIIKSCMVSLGICISILDSFKFLFGLIVKIKGRVRPLCCTSSRYVYLTPPQVATCDVVVIAQYSLSKEIGKFRRLTTKTR